MSTAITLPDNMNFINAKNFCMQLDSHPKDEDFVFDYSRMGNVEPFGMLLIGAKMRSFMAERPFSNFKAVHFDGNDYAAHMGFYKSIGLDYGKAPGQARGSKTYLPITELVVSDVREESRFLGEHVVDTLERHAAKVAKVLSCGSKDLKDVLTYSIREIMRNVVEHSRADSIWFAGQAWATKDKVEISILDQGMGIFNSLKANRKLKLSTSDESLYLALEPGISGKDVRKEAARDGVYGNSGYGLFMTSRICEDGGNFIIGSDNKVLGINKKSSRMVDFSHSGTVIRMILRPSNVKSLSSLTSKYLKEGAERTKRHKHSDIISASKSSRLLLRDAQHD